MASERFEIPAGCGYAYREDLIKAEGKKYETNPEVVPNVTWKKTLVFPMPKPLLWELFKNTKRMTLKRDYLESKYPGRLWFQELGQERTAEHRVAVLENQYYAHFEVEGLPYASQQLTLSNVDLEIHCKQTTEEWNEWQELLEKRAKNAATEAQEEQSRKRIRAQMEAARRYRMQMQHHMAQAAPSQRSGRPSGYPLHGAQLEAYHPSSTPFDSNQFVNSSPPTRVPRKAVVPSTGGIQQESATLAQGAKRKAADMESDISCGQGMLVPESKDATSEANAVLRAQDHVPKKTKRFSTSTPIPVAVTRSLHHSSGCQPVFAKRFTPIPVYHAKPPQKFIDHPPPDTTSVSPGQAPSRKRLCTKYNNTKYISQEQYESQLRTFASKQGTVLLQIIFQILARKASITKLTPDLINKALSIFAANLNVKKWLPGGVLGEATHNIVDGQFVATSKELLAGVIYEIQRASGKGPERLANATDQSAIHPRLKMIARAVAVHISQPALTQKGTKQEVGQYLHQAARLYQIQALETLTTKAAKQLEVQQQQMLRQQATLRQMQMQKQEHQIAVLAKQQQVPILAQQQRSGSPSIIGARYRPSPQRAMSGPMQTTQDHGQQMQSAQQDLGSPYITAEELMSLRHITSTQIGGVKQGHQTPVHQVQHMVSASSHHPISDHTQSLSPSDNKTPASAGRSTHVDAVRSQDHGKHIDPRIITTNGELQINGNDGEVSPSLTHASSSHDISPRYSLLTPPDRLLEFDGKERQMLTHGVLFGSI